MLLPTIPAEVPYTDIERDLIENEPPGMFPEDQNSYWGQMRKLFADYLQANAMDLFTQWYNNLDPRNVDASDIAEWEYRVGVPGDRSSLTLPARRAFVQNRLKVGVFSRALISSTVENFITATFGVSTSFGTGGIALDAGGATLFSGVSGDPKTMYRVYFDYASRTYYVRILNTLGEDLSGLTRELQRVTPGGWTLNISDVANILDYQKMILDRAPNGYWRMASLADISGYAQNATGAGGITVGGAASLRAVDANAATLFDGVDDYLTVPAFSLWDAGNPDIFSLEAWVKPSSLPSSGNYFHIFSRGNNGYRFRIASTGQLVLAKAGVADIVMSTTALVANTVYHVVATKNGSRSRLYINGVDRTGTVTDQQILGTGGGIWVGQRSDNSGYFPGVMDELAIYPFELTAAEVLAHYNTGTNVA